MTIETMLKEEVGWLDDVSVQSVMLEIVNEKGERDVWDCWMEDELDTDVAIAYFYALSEEGFYWGHVGAGEYTFVDYQHAFMDVMEYEDIDIEWVTSNPKRIGPMITDSIINDKDMFEGFWLLTSYQQIYNDFPLIDCLRAYLTEYYETIISNDYPQEVENARFRKAHGRG